MKARWQLIGHCQSECPGIRSLLTMAYIYSIIVNIAFNNNNKRTCSLTIWPSGAPSAFSSWRWVIPASPFSSSLAVAVIVGGGQRSLHSPKDFQPSTKTWRSWELELDAVPSKTISSTEVEVRPFQILSVLQRWWFESLKKGIWTRTSRERGTKNNL